jgi:urea transporter
MAPAAYHRIATGGEDTSDVDTFGSWAMLAAMVFLGAALAGDFYVILGMVMESQAFAAIAAIVALAIAFLLWFGYPCAVRKKGRAVG